MCRTDLAVKILDLRQQVAALKTKASPPKTEPGRPIVLDQRYAVSSPVGPRSS